MNRAGALPARAVPSPHFEVQRQADFFLGSSDTTRTVRGRASPTWAIWHSLGMTTRRARRRARGSHLRGVLEPAPDGTR
jgi:hypothetical protein